MRTRRNFVRALLTIPALAALSDSFAFSKWEENQQSYSHKFKLSLNLYSFNAFLKEKKVDLFDMLDFCAQHNFDAIDPTGYYFLGYPAVPTDDFINNFKRRAFILGLDISGTGVRNNFAVPDANKRNADIEHIKQWIEVSAKMGSPHLRIFAGEHNHKGYSKNQVFEWMAKDIRECCNYGKKHGVIIALQNHNGFLKTADDVNILFEKVNSEWLGLNLDIGSYRQKDPYEEVAKNIHHAVTWQIKENVWMDGQEKHTDFLKLFTIIKKAGYRGYLPLETLGEGDPFQKVEGLLKEVKRAMAQVE